MLKIVRLKHSGTFHTKTFQYSKRFFRTHTFKLVYLIVCLRLGGKVTVQSKLATVFDTEEKQLCLGKSKAQLPGSWVT